MHQHMQSLQFGQTFPSGVVLDPDVFGMNQTHQLTPGNPVPFVQCRTDNKSPLSAPPPIMMKYPSCVPPPVTTVPSGLGSSAPPPRKRKRTGRTENEELSFVAIDRDVLLQMSLSELEAHIQQRAAIRNFTEVEQREIKRQRRLVKNREYAQTSRIKKKQYVEELKQENEILKERVRVLTQENEQLRSQFQSSPNQQRLSPNATTFVSQSPPWSPESSPATSGWSSPSNSNYSDSGEDNAFFETDILNTGSSISFEDISFSGDSKSSIPFSSAYATSFCLFVFLFSFGLFTIPGLFSATPIIASPNGPIPSQSIPLPAYGYRTGRSLLSDPLLERDYDPQATDPNTTTYMGSTTLLTMDDVIAEEVSFVSHGSLSTNYTIGKSVAVQQLQCEVSY
eukprot:TRINITY_DN15789_c0_g1_i1.p1 TRINITY_DN15789_c0_g1~~TRINITY_DN15789_c0_g1_i1.p1  ORF type:complete len:395 (-),score=81.75 TRINITY_DN15789_c0_g1_i1:58-1242(-)